MTTRRTLLQTAIGGVAVAGTGLLGQLARAALPAGAVEAGVLGTLPGKQPLIRRSYRPPNYETPLEYFNDVITPNDRFFVRWHLANIPELDAAEWKLAIGGEGVETPYVVTLDQLRRDFEPVEVVAVCQCSGNRRGHSDPHVPGVQWGDGAMGNARWKGVRLKDILARAGLRKEAIEIAFNGADAPPLEKTPDFLKSIPTAKAMDGNAMIAFEMNGAPLPHWNGYPARIVVPGWTATYWMKQVVSIQALTKPLSNFWMTSAYRMPRDLFPLVDRFSSQESETNTPITEIVVNSRITNLADGARHPAGRPVTVQGVAWDGGYGIRRVEVSRDAGHSWDTAELGADLGRFSFRPWKYGFTPRAKGPLSVMVRATNARGSSQPTELLFNPAGYHNNVIHTVNLQVI
jgi:DMSO/TMAO reductase YedYZ molybdopterin-dependent catalytic subunit